MTQAVEVVDLSKDFDGTSAVDKVSFTVPVGQVCALLGPNGAGKTTTMHMLLGLIEPTSGSISVLGRDVVRERSAAVRRTNFMASYVAFPWRMRVREMLRVYAELYEVTDPKGAIDEVTEVVGIGHLLDRLPQTMSSGQQTMVGLAKSLLNRPALLFLDEPTASLDPENAVDLRQVIRGIADESGMTVLITSHNMLEIERLADRILFMAKGRLVADATSSELREQFGAADLEEVFLAMAREARPA